MSNTNQYVLPSDPESRKKIKGAVQEAVDSNIRISSERDLIKDIRATACKEHNISPKLFNKLVRTQLKDNYGEVVEENGDFESAYSILYDASEE